MNANRFEIGDVWCYPHNTLIALSLEHDDRVMFLCLVGYYGITGAPGIVIKASSNAIRRRYKLVSRLT